MSTVTRVKQAAVMTLSCLSISLLVGCSSAPSPTLPTGEHAAEQCAKLVLTSSSAQLACENGYNVTLKTPAEAGSDTQYGSAEAARAHLYVPQLSQPVIDGLPPLEARVFFGPPKTIAASGNESSGTVEQTTSVVIICPGVSQEAQEQEIACSVMR